MGKENLKVAWDLHKTASRANTNGIGLTSPETQFGFATTDHLLICFLCSRSRQKKGMHSMSASPRAYQETWDPENRGNMEVQISAVGT